MHYIQPNVHFISIKFTKCLSIFCKMSSKDFFSNLFDKENEIYLCRYYATITSSYLCEEKKKLNVVNHDYRYSKPRFCIALHSIIHIKYFCWIFLQSIILLCVNKDFFFFFLCVCVVQKFVFNPIPKWNVYY